MTYLNIDQIKAIPKLLAEHYSVSEIALKFNCHPQTVHAWIKKLRASGQEIKLKSGRIPLINKIRIKR